jgi:hypothetical protein
LFHQREKSVPDDRYLTEWTALLATRIEAIRWANYALLLSFRPSPPRVVDPRATQPGVRERAKFDGSVTNRQRRGHGTDKKPLRTREELGKVRVML